MLSVVRGVEYPKLYAEGTDAVSVKFNCTQRAHQNTLENLPVFLIMQILLAQAYPMLASALGAAWAVGKDWFHMQPCAIELRHPQSCTMSLLSCLLRVCSNSCPMACAMSYCHMIVLWDVVDPC